MYTEKEILNFIDTFKYYHKEEVEDLFLHGCCYWFADILERQFNGEKYYDPVAGHFISKIENHFYDIRGNIDKEYLGENDDLISWKEYQEIEPLDSSRCIKYCKDLKN